MRIRFHGRRNLILALLSGFFGLGFFAVQPAWATIIVPTCARVVGSSPPDLNCILETFTNIASLIIGITGSAALLMFVYGGFTMITSAGSSDKVKKGKTILTNAIIGIVLIFTAGYIIDYVKLRLTTGTQQQVSGSACNDGKGTYQSVKGVLTCLTPCSAMQTAGYQCIDPSLGRDCSDYIGCGTGSQCCIPLTPEELQLQQSTPSSTP